ncbi:MAG: glycosyltransferase family 39 protein [Chitinophagales bacterium]|nr:glycosyltransferase family 39 protein [Chitinophagales bacterium]
MKIIHWLILMLLVVSLPVFVHLDDAPVQLWDESRLAMSAYEMSQNGNLLVPTFQHSPDMWNLKPPFMIWCMALSIKMFGVSELSVRLPTAIAAIFTFTLLFLFVYKVLKKPSIAFIVCFVLVTSAGYVRMHGIRTGDYDGMLALFTTAYLCFYFLYLNTEKTKYFYCFFAALFLASMTKGIAAFLFLPGVFLYTLFAKKLKSVLTTKHLYIGIVLFSVSMIAYYVVREQYNPGYFKAVCENELLGRYTNVIENHIGPWHFYIKNMIDYNLIYWYVPFCFALVYAIYSNHDEKHLIIYAALTAITYLTVISASKSKLLWYDLPVYPMIAIPVAIFINSAFELLRDHKNVKRSLINIFTVFAIVICGFAYLHTMNDVMHPVKDYDMDANQYMALYMKEAKQDIRNINGFVFTDDTKQNQNILFYYNILKDKNRLQYKEMKNLTEKDTIIMFSESEIHKLNQDYYAKGLDCFANVKTFVIYGRK